MADIARAAPDDVAAVAGAIQASGAAMFDRSPAFWRWRFEEAPDLAYRFARASRGGDCAGLAVWREPLACELPVGTLAEVLAPRGDEAALGALIAHACSAMADCEAVVAGAADPLVAAALRRAGFRQVKTHRPTVSSRDAEVLARIAAHQGPWHMSKADHDWDQIHPVP